MALVKSLSEIFLVEVMVSVTKVFCACPLPDLRQELAVKQKQDHRPPLRVSKDTDKSEAPSQVSGRTSIPATPANPIGSFCTPSATHYRGEASALTAAKKLKKERETEIRFSQGSVLQPLY